MPFTEDELRAVREADAEIERIFEAEYFKSRKDHVEIDKMLDSEIVKDGKSRKIAARQKAYREANKDRIAAYQKAYREANKDELAAYQKAYYEANKDEIAARRKAYREAKKERPRRSGNSRRGKEKKFVFSVAESEEMSRWKK